MVLRQQEGKEGALFWAVLVDANLFSIRVCADQVAQQVLLEEHCRREALTSRADSRLQTDHVELELLCSEHASDQVGEASLIATRQEHRESVLLLH